MVTDAPIITDVLTADRLRAVGRRIVGDDQLEILEGLSQKGGKCLFEEALAIEDRQADAHPGHGGFPKTVAPRTTEHSDERSDLELATLERIHDAFRGPGRERGDSECGVDRP